MNSILCVIGTRPEGIKMAPVIQRLQQETWAQPKILATAQHREMLDQVLELFSLRPDIDLNLMQAGQSLADLTGRLSSRLDRIYQEKNPALVIAQGDTTTVMMAAMTAFYRRIPFAHVEAGLRTGDRLSPFPEEMNRYVTAYLTDLHFAPTQTAKANLLREGVREQSIHVTGNTVIDALLYQSQQAHELALPLAPKQRLILLTAHRRENFGAPLRAVFEAVLKLLEVHSDIHVLYPVHPNPQVKQMAYEMLGDHPRVTLSEPLSYADFVAAMKRCHFILTDSGGVQEEAPALGKPVLVLRHETERPEAVEAAVVKLVGTDSAAIFQESSKLLNDAQAYREMARGVSPYGDGKAAERIVTAIQDYFHIGKQ